MAEGLSQAVNRGHWSECGDIVSQILKSVSQVVDIPDPAPVEHTRPRHATRSDKLAEFRRGHANSRRGFRFAKAQDQSGMPRGGGHGSPLSRSCQARKSSMVLIVAAVPRGRVGFINLGHASFAGSAALWTSD